MELVSSIGELASLIGSLTVVGGALIWIYNKLINKPRERRRERINKENQDRMIKLIMENNQPLNDAITELNSLLAESQADRKKLNKIAVENVKWLENHEDILDNHDDRLIVLETKSGLRKVVVSNKDSSKNGG